MKLAGAVLAGGQSSRMGFNKAWLKRDGQSLASRGLSLMREAGLDPLFLNASQAPADLPLSVTLIPDDLPGQGPLEGLATLLRRLDRPVLACAVDMPGLDLQAFKSLALAYERSPGPGLVSRSQNAWHPLFAVYSPALLPAIEAALSSGQRALKPLIESQNLPAWEAASEKWLANLNKPQDLAAWKAEHGSLEPPE